MTQNNQLIRNVKTNIITGFLGVGKTTAINKLLDKRLLHERWSVLVNELGERGIDGHLMEENTDTKVTIKQVPGGCICCAAGLSLQVAVNQLLRQTHPDRLIIEPSGMGHPRNILKSLTAPVYHNVLDMRACLCLLDPRKLKDLRYLESELFIDQMDVADRIVANKTDLCCSRDKDNFERFIAQRYKNKATSWIRHAELQRDWLDETHHDSVKTEATLSNRLESCFYKISLDFSLDTIFDYAGITQFIDSLSGVERFKGILHTSKGFIAINHSADIIHYSASANRLVNRIEMIALKKYIKHELQQDFYQFLLK